jgi:arsenite/tail-anchored protein-transporting ATPase
VRHLLSRRVLFFGGKGGVGKTTCAAALALAASRLGRRVLLVSTDPAHSTSDILEVPLGAAEREVQPGLAAMEIDADTEARRYLDEAKQRMAGLFSPAVLKEAARQIELTASMPGVADVALFDRMSQLIVSDAGRFDLVVFDTAPTGHSLRLLRMPELMGTWVAALSARRREAADAATRANDAGGAEERRGGRDPVLEILEARMARLSAVREELTRADRTAFVLVLIPERLPIEESARAAHQLTDAGVQLGGLVVNRVLPDEAEGPYSKARKAQERIHLAEIARRLPDGPRVVVPQFESDVHGLASLERVGRYLLDDSAVGR